MNLYILSSISSLGVVGLFVSFYIFNKKNKKEKLICRTRNSCDRVVHSSYSKFIGIPLENIGILYYFFCGIIYNLVFLLNYNIFVILPILFFVNMIAFFFSFRLILIQLLIIKKWCTWCLASALISFLIFVMSFVLLKYEIFL